MTAKKKDTPLPAPNPNLELWNRLCRTNPANTTQCTQRGGFTAISAHSQIMIATEAWGPCGGRWGFSFEWIQDADLWAAQVTLRYPPITDPDTGEALTTDCTVSQVGTAARKGKYGLDEDAPKKAITDGLTKCFSYTGMNADVFMGKFDDNKYVAQMRAEFTNPNGSGVSTGADSLPPKSERVPPPNQARLTGKTRMKQLAEKLCGDRDWFDFLQSLAADLGFPMEPDAMSDEQFAHTIEELAAMEQSRLEFIRAGQTKTDELPGMPPSAPMSAYDGDDDLPF